MNSKMENIEQLIFDYHEGNLSDSEKAELLNLIHHNPELEKDFAQWAQTYAHIPNDVPDYGLTNVLLQKAVPVWYNQQWLPLSIATAVIIGILGHLLWPEKKSTKEIPTSYQIIVAPVGKQFPQAKTLAPTAQSAIILPEKQLKVQKPESVQDLKKDNADKSSIVEKAESKPEITQKESQEIKPEPEITTTIKPDTLQNLNSTKNQTTKQENTKTKPKRKQLLNLKPSPDFMPVNPNF